MNYLVAIEIDEECSFKKNINDNAQTINDLEEVQFYVLVKGVQRTHEVLTRLDQWLNTPNCILTNLDQLVYNLAIIVVKTETEEEFDEFLEGMELLETLEPIDSLASLSKIANLSNKKLT